MKLLLSCLVIFMTFSMMSFGQKANKLDEKHSAGDHLAGKSAALKLNFEKYYQVEDELLMQFQTRNNLANISIDGNSNEVIVTQNGDNNFENVMMWGNQNQVVIQQTGSSENYASVFILGNNNIININQ